jgi:hypothetical protein
LKPPLPLPVLNSLYRTFRRRIEMGEICAAEDFPRPLGSPIRYRLRRNGLHCNRIYVRADAFLGRHQAISGQSSVHGSEAKRLRATQRHVIGEENAQRYAAILLTGAYGADGLENGWPPANRQGHTTAEELIDTLVATVVEPDRPD